jgi:hypothetical protein
MTDVTKLSNNAVPKYKTRYSAIHIVGGIQTSTVHKQIVTCEVWQESNATGNAVHKPTTLPPPPSHCS